MDAERAKVQGRRSKPLSWQFWIYWISDLFSNSGIALSILVIQLVVLKQLQGNDADVGFIRAANTVPLVLFGILSGVLADRYPRIRILLVAAVTSASAMGLLGVLVWAGDASILRVALLMFLVGASTTFQAAAHQSFIPDLVGEAELHRANRWLSKGAQIAAMVGAVVAGFAFEVMPAAQLLLLDSFTFACVAGVCIALWRTELPQSDGKVCIAEEAKLDRGFLTFAKWLYSYPPLSAYAWSLHVWFIGNGICTTLFIVHAVTTTNVSSGISGLALAMGGAAGVVGAHYSGWLEQVLGTKRSLSVSWVATGLGFLLLGLPVSHSSSVVLLFACQIAFGFGMGSKLPIEMTYRNRVTPRNMRGRMNSYIRTLNWGVFALSAAIAGVLASQIGTRPVIVAGACAMIVSGFLIQRSRMETLTEKQ